MDWSEKLGEVVIDSLPWVWKLLPDGKQKELRARLRDHTPWDRISANEDLLRALRLSWITVALKVDAEVLSRVQEREWQPLAQRVRTLSGLLQSELKRLRAEAFDRDKRLVPIPIDEHLTQVLTAVPDYVRSRSGGEGDALTEAFVPALALTLGWAETEMPDIYAQVARVGLTWEGEGAFRPFGELVFAEFAEIIKHPQRHAEASAAFNMSQASMAREMILSVLQAINGVDEKLDHILAEVTLKPFLSLEELGALVDNNAKSLDEILVSLDKLSNQQGQILDAVRRLPTQQDLRDRMDAAVAQLSTITRTVADEIGPLRALLVQLSQTREEMIPLHPFREVLAEFGKVRGDTASVTRLLMTYTRRYLELEKQDASVPYDTPFQVEIESLLHQGDLQGADKRLEELQHRQSMAIDATARLQARVLSDRARIAFLKGDLTAAAHFMTQAIDRAASDKSLQWAYALQSFTMVCLDWKIVESEEYGGPLRDQPLVFATDAQLQMPPRSDAEWELCSTVIRKLKTVLQGLIAQDPNHEDFRSWSMTIYGIAADIRRLARGEGRLPDILESQAVVAGLDLFAISFWSSDGADEIASHGKEQDEARDWLKQATSRLRAGPRGQKSFAPGHSS